MSTEAAIRDLIDQWSEATNQPGEAGADGYVSYVTDDVVSLPPNRERTDGKDALRAFALEFTGADEWSIKFQASEVTVAGSGDIAHAVGTYRFHIVDPDGNAIDDAGKFLDTLALQEDGSWKVTTIAYNSDLPAA